MFLGLCVAIISISTQFSVRECDFACVRSCALVLGVSIGGSVWVVLILLVNVELSVNAFRILCVYL